MYAPEELQFDGMAIDPGGWNFVNVHGTDNRLNRYSGDKMLPLQFTGLHDKNGKEIYEGDIVLDHWNAVREVLYDAPVFTVKAPDQSESLKDWDEGLRALNGCEVIGNIYENPERSK